MNLVKRIFENKRDNREGAFLTVAYAIATTTTKTKRMKIFNALMDLIEEEERALKDFKTGNIFCGCGNSLDPGDNQNFCEDCLEYQKS